MDKRIIQIASGILGLTLSVTGACCLKKENKCDITDSFHVHLYEDDTGNFRINNYINSEKDNLHRFSKTDNIVLTTTEDLNVYELLSDDYVDARDNIDYINYQIKTNRDYMEYYYYYTETEVIAYTTYDSDGNASVHLQTVVNTYNGWDRNPKHRGVTGKLRVCHTMYRMSKIEKKLNDFLITNSNLVDDPRELIDGYPYMNINNDTIVSTEFNFSPDELPNINIEDIDPYYTPNIENNLILKK